MDTGSGSTRSLWMTGVDLPRYGPLDDNLDADVCVIGAGIAGLSVAYGLVRIGRRVVVLEDGGSIGAGETSRTTAHLVNAFDDRYAHVARLHGEKAARLTAESHTMAIESIERIAIAEGIDCSFERVDGYLFTPPGDPQDILEHELEACHAAGLAQVHWVERAPIHEFHTGRCLCFPRQAQMHPMRYLAGLARAIVGRGGRIFTGTHAKSMESRGENRAMVLTGESRAVSAHHVVVATNTPVQDLLTMHTKQYPYRTYVIASKLAKGGLRHALYWDTPYPYHYVRMQTEGDDEYLIVGGEDHKTGQDDGRDRYGALEAWARERFPRMREIEYRWSGQVMEPMDALGYIGRNPGDENIWVVSGDSGNGMTNGAIAGLLLPELMLGHAHPWAALYDPARKSLRAAAEFTRENVNMAAQYGSWVTGGDVEDESEIPRGSGAVVRDGLKKTAVYRDEDGELHRCSAVCPHLGAIVTWNEGEHTWDCPAHGSRFDAHGRVLNGPANTDLPGEQEEPAPVRRRKA